MVYDSGGYFANTDSTKSARRSSTIFHRCPFLTKDILRVANARVLLRQRILLLDKIKALFHYWHVVHLPFSLVMFAILLIHIGVAIAFGYTWIW